MPQPTAGELARGIEVLRDETDLEVRMVAAVRSRDFETSEALRAELLMKWIGDDWDCAELRAAIEQACSGPSAIFLWMGLTHRLKNSERNEALDPWVDMLLYQMHGSNTLPALVASWKEEPLPRIWSDRVMESLGRLIERRLVSNPESVAAIADFARSGPALLLEQCIANPDANPSLVPTLLPPRSTLQGIVRVMSSLSVEERQRWLERILKPHVPLEIQMDAIEAWIGGDRGLQEWVASRLQQLPPPVAHSGMKTLIRNESGTMLLLDLLDSHQLESAKVPAWVWQTLRAVSNESIRKRAARWDRIGTASWESIADRYRIPWREPGSAERGAAHFQKWCASCHRVNGIGIALGPSLDSYRVRPNEAIAMAIAEPSREMDSKYEQHQVRTNDGEIVVGLLTASSANRISLLTAQNETKNLAREEIDEWNASGRSMMPDGLLKELDPTALNDLIAFLRQQPTN
jgi:putative heme-binding domain-containing protein